MPHSVNLDRLSQQFLVVIDSLIVAQEEEKTVEEEHEITHRVYLDVDIDGQRVGTTSFSHMISDETCFFLA